MDAKRKFLILINTYRHDKSVYPKIVGIFHNFAQNICNTPLLQYAIVNKIDPIITNMIYQYLKQDKGWYIMKDPLRFNLFKFTHNCQCNVNCIPLFTGNLDTFINAICHEDIDYYRELAKVLGVRFFESNSDRHEYLKNILKL
jgi:hypothetical protein